MIEKISNLPEQVCFENDGFVFCNWVPIQGRPDYAITGNNGKWLRFESYEKVSTAVEAQKENRPLALAKGLSSTISFESNKN